MVTVVKAMRVVQALQCTCQRCGHVWLAVTMAPPPKCAKCKSRYWATERQRDTRAGGIKGGPRGRGEAPPAGRARRKP